MTDEKYLQFKSFIKEYVTKRKTDLKNPELDFDKLDIPSLNIEQKFLLFGKIIDIVDSECEKLKSSMKMYQRYKDAVDKRKIIVNIRYNFFITVTPHHLQTVLYRFHWNPESLHKKRHLS